MPAILATRVQLSSRLQAQLGMTEATTRSRYLLRGMVLFSAVLPSTTSPSPTASQMWGTGSALRARQEVASAAVRLVSQYAFGTLGFTRLEIACLPTNTSSRRVAEKVGAKLEAMARNRLVMHGVAYAAAVYSLVPEDMAKSP